MKIPENSKQYAQKFSSAHLPFRTVLLGVTIVVPSSMLILAEKYNHNPTKSGCVNPSLNFF